MVSNRIVWVTDGVGINIESSLISALFSVLASSCTSQRSVLPPSSSLDGGTPITTGLLLSIVLEGATVGWLVDYTMCGQVQQWVKEMRIEDEGANATTYRRCHHEEETRQNTTRYREERRVGWFDVDSTKMRVRMGFQY